MLLIAAGWMNIMPNEANVEKGTIPGTYTVDQYGTPKQTAPQSKFPRPSRPNIRR